MTLYDFYTMSAEKQKERVLQDGVHLTSRNTGEITIRLYQIEGFYVEAYFDEIEQELIPLRSFRTTDLLTPYLKEIDISGLFA